MQDKFADRMEGQTEQPGKPPEKDGKEDPKKNEVPKKRVKAPPVPDPILKEEAKEYDMFLTKVFEHWEKQILKLICQESHLYTVTELDTLFHTTRRELR